MSIAPEIRLAYLDTSAAVRAGRRPVFTKPYSGPMIKVTMTEIPGSTTENNSAKFRAVAVVDGVEYVGESRRGASCVLARKLKAADIPDQPMSICNEIGEEMMRWNSFHRAAEKTYAESERSTLRCGKFVDPALRTGQEVAAED